MTFMPRKSEPSESVAAAFGLIAALFVVAAVILALVAGYGYLRELVR